MAADLFGGVFSNMFGGLGASGILTWVTFGLYAIIYVGGLFLIGKLFLSYRKHKTRVYDHLIKGNNEIIVESAGGFIRDKKTKKTYFEIVKLPLFWKTTKLLSLPEHKHFIPVSSFFKKDCVHRIVTGPDSYMWAEPKLEDGTAKLKNIEFDKNAAMQTIRDQWSLREDDIGWWNKWGTPLVMFSFILTTMIVGIIFLDKFQDVAGAFVQAADLLSQKCVQQVGG